MAPPAGRRPERGAGPRERVEDRVAFHREHPDDPLRERRRKRRTPAGRRRLPDPADILPDLAEPPVALRPGEPARDARGVVPGELAEVALPEEENVLAVEGDVGVGGKEPRAEESVRAVGRFLPKDVRKRGESDSGRRDERLRRVRPDPELAVDRAKRIPDVDGEDSTGHEHPMALRPRRLQDPKYPGVIGRPECTEQSVPLRDHRIGGRGEHEVDRAVGDSAQSSSIPVDEADGPSGRRQHGRREPKHG